MKQSKPYRFQSEDADVIEDKFGGTGLLASEMGLGKSLTALLNYKRYADKSKPCIIVCPATLKENWRRECRKHFGYHAHILESRTPSHSLHYKKGILIINYEILQYWVDYLIDLEPATLIWDECVKAKNPVAKCTKALRKLSHFIPRKIAISGTPLVNRPAELWPTLNMLRPDLYSSFFPFALDYCNAKKTFWGWDVSGASNLPILHENLSHECMIRRLKKDVLKQLPQKTTTVVPFKLPNMKEYHKALYGFLAWLRKYSKSKAIKADRAEKLTQLGYLRRLSASLKLPMVIKWIEDYFEDNNEKLLLFAIHKTIIKKLKKHFKGKCVVVDGSITGAKRQQAIDKFNKNKSCRLFIGNIQAAGVGWSCTSTSNVAFAELPWTPGEVNQAIDRCHGLFRGKKGVKVSAYFLVALGTIESMLCNLLQRKQGTLDQVLDGSIQKESLDIFTKLEQKLLRMGKK
jgi:SWI/SNF-related matrix-associated actin-dependent regulator 1 of chromatin subfamily A